ncbi:MAG: hypothetical protein QOD72_3004, partial [Acidimicrobiaceae bacterium]|nr:hypothetical protein [Acidimicrobiaceae bacterium]
LVDWMDSQGLATDLTDDAYSDLVHRQQNFSHVQDVVECFFLLQDAITVYHEGQARGLPIGILNAPEDLYDDEHLRERGVFAEVKQPGHGTVLHPVSPYRFSTFAPVAPGPAPRLGEHNAGVGAVT